MSVLPGNTQKPMWTEKVQAIGVSCGLVLTACGLIVASWQLNDVGKQLSSNASTAIFNQQLEVNSAFLEDGGTELTPFFFDDQKIPANDLELSQRVSVVASNLLDFFSHLEDQQDAGTFTIDEGWSAYISDSFKKSPILCETLMRDIEAYGGEGGLLWKEFASKNCGQ